MKALILGGTRFIGRQIAEAVLERGHELTLFHRGQTGTELFPAAEHVLGDRRSDNPFRPLSGQEFDFVVDTSAYFPPDLRALHPLADAIGHYTFMSSLSVLEEHDNFCRAANTKAVSEGLEFRELAATIRDTIAWDRERPRKSMGRLPTAKEAEIIAQTRAA